MEWLEAVMGWLEAVIESVMDWLGAMLWSLVAGALGYVGSMLWSLVAGVWGYVLRQMWNPYFLIFMAIVVVVCKKQWEQWHPYLKDWLQTRFPDPQPHTLNAGEREEAVQFIAYLMNTAFVQWIVKHTDILDTLIPQVRESDCLEACEMSLEALASLAIDQSSTTNLCNRGCLTLITDFVSRYAAISEPTDQELYCLNAATKAFKRISRYLQPPHLDSVQGILPVIVSIFKEPGNREEAQMNVTNSLGYLAKGSLQATNLLLDGGVLKMLVDTAREGTENTTVLIKALRSIYNAFDHTQMIQPTLVLGALDALHAVLKRPNVGCDTEDGETVPMTPWFFASATLSKIAGGTQDQREAILSKDGLLEMVLEQGMAKPVSNESFPYHYDTALLLQRLMVHGTESQMRGLMSKNLLLRLLAHYLKADDPGWTLENGLSLHFAALEAVQADLQLNGSGAGLRLRRRLFDNVGIIDAIRRLSLKNDSYPQCQVLALNIFDTYFKDHLPPLPPSKLPAIIYTKNPQS